jgi:dTDP-4-amino-4,6-dideoxygalactose transaminase
MAVTNLALHGGSKTVTVADPEGWRAFGTEEADLVEKLAEAEELSATGAGVTKAFEEAFARYVGRPYALSQMNGTSTFWGAYFAVGVGPGDEVIHPTYAWIGSIAPAVFLGARPVFCEVDPQTLTADPKDIERRITARTRAICVAHLFGNPADMDGVMEVSRRYGIPVIEDCSHAHGAEWDGRKVGSIGDIGCFSLQGEGRGAMSVGEGGVAVTSNREYYERLLISGHLNRRGVAEELTRPEYAPLGNTCLGVKFRAHALGVGLGREQVRKLDSVNEKRRAVHQRLNRIAGEIPGLEAVRVLEKAMPGGFYGYRLLYRPEDLGGVPVETYVKALQAEGAQVTGCDFPLLHRLPLFAEGFDLYGGGRGPLSGDYPGYREGDLPVSEEVHGRALALPAFTDPRPGVLEQYMEAFRKVAANAGALR